MELIHVGNYSSNSDDEKLPLTPFHEDQEEMGKPSQKKGLNTWQTGCLLFGCVGSGIFVLPPFFAKAGYVAFVLFILLLLQSQYAAALLGRCWVITKERNPQYQESHVRYPYAAIAYESYGSWCRWFYIVVIAIFTVSTMAAMLLMLTDLFRTTFDELFPHLEISFCSLPPILAVVIVPLTFFGTPHNFWFGGVLGSVTTVLAVICIVIRSLIDAYHDTGQGPPPGTPLSATAVISFIGTFFFAAFNSYVYPTIQHDMSKPEQFTITLAASNVAVCIAFLSAAIPTYFVYGAAMTPVGVENVIQVLPDGPLRLMCSAVMLPHFLLAIMIFANPLNQQVEELLDIPLGFNWKRCVARILILFVVVFIAETLPHFGVLMPLIGGTLSVITGLVGPLLFYLKLYPLQTFTHASQSRSVPGTHRILCYFLIGITPLFIVIIIYTGIDAIVKDQSAFTMPCYVNASVAHI